MTSQQSSGYSGLVFSDDGFPLDRIVLRRISAQGNHGVLASEKDSFQPFNADVTLYLDTTAAATSDDLAKTVDYGAVAKVVHDILAGPHADLIETLAERVAAGVLSFSQVIATDVVIRKPEAPLEVPFADIEVAIHRDRRRKPAVSAASLGSVPIADTPISEGSTVVVEPSVSDSPAPLEPPVSESAEPAINLLDAVPAEPVTAIIALGSNLGDSRATLKNAVVALHAEPGVAFGPTDVGPLARTAAVGGPAGQDDFLNSVLRVHTTLSPRQLLAVLHRVEAEFGRERTGVINGPRTLDLDIITYGDLVVGAPDLALPHKQAGHRAFVLLPWAQLDPAAVLPGIGGGPVATLADAAPDRAGIRNMMLNWIGDAIPAMSSQPVATAFTNDHHFGLAPDPMAVAAPADVVPAPLEHASAAFGHAYAPLDHASEPLDQSGALLDHGNLPPVTALNSPPLAELPEWSPPVHADAPLPTFTGIIAGVPSSRTGRHFAGAADLIRKATGREAQPSAQDRHASAPAAPSEPIDPPSVPTFTGTLRAESPLAARAARFAATDQHGAEGFQSHTPLDETLASSGYPPQVHAAWSKPEPEPEIIEKSQQLDQLSARPKPQPNPTGLPAWDDIIHG
ncbi:MAG: 2-amino-4-hydroxy-6-hydroxymethyldihydropteridine diphosphokinase [Cellulomonadaceae bacterium]|jgi:dihydroneopterin aldolase/2-amino-4-hydroxy-6-hydroxymethyldihydropteridine diphosphokinase|nr:2-amino-4-hydroxy-6-hydroxymethyldihydropteridine diphosphokinase [Cellulomonadaceae bacterium]